MVKISSIFVAFLENMNFTSWLCRKSCKFNFAEMVCKRYLLKIINLYTKLTLNSVACPKRAWYWSQDTEACPTQRPFFMHFLGLSYPLYGAIMHQVTFVRPMHTLIYLINAQDGINEQEGNFPKLINRAGWNKRAGRAKENFSTWKIVSRVGKKSILLVYSIGEREGLRILSMINTKVRSS